MPTLDPDCGEAAAAATAAGGISVASGRPELEGLMAKLAAPAGGAAGGGRVHVYVCGARSLSAAVRAAAASACPCVAHVHTVNWA